MSPRLIALTVVLALAAAPSGAVVSGRAGAARPAYTANAPRLATALRAQLAMVDLTRSPALLAGDLAGRLNAPGLSPEQYAAARLTLDAVARPAALPLVQEVLRDATAAGGEAAAEALGALARRVHERPADAQAFMSALYRLPEFEQLTVLAAMDAGADGLRESLDEFFTGGARSDAEDAGAVNAGAAESRPAGPASWRLSRPTPTVDPMQESFSVFTGRNRREGTVTLQQLLDALDSGDSALLDRLLPKRVRGEGGAVVRLGNGKVRIIVAIDEHTAKSQAGRMVWADFYEGDNHPLLERLARKFTFAPFRHSARRGNSVEYEAPSIDKDNLQFTTYGIRLSPDGEVLDDEKMHIYAGKSFLVTTHDKHRPSVTKAQHLITETARYKSPTEMSAFLLSDTINRYSMAVDSLSKDFSAIAQKAEMDKTDDTILTDVLKTGRKIDHIYETVLRQKQVLRDILSINEFHHSPFVNPAELQKQLQALDHHLDVLDHYQDRKNGLVELYRAKVGNDLNLAMKRLASVPALLAPAAIIGALYGMNVALPGAASAYAFWIVLGLIASITGGLFVLLRKQGWL